MLTNLEVLAMTGAGLTGPLPTEYANFLGAKAVAATAAADAAEAAARAASVTEQYKRAASFSYPRAARNVSTENESSGGRNQRLGAVRQYTKAYARAVTTRRVAEAVQDAASPVTPAATTTAVIGMLKLRQLLLNGNSLSGSLPVAYSQMRELQVSGDTQCTLMCAARDKFDVEQGGGGSL
jgi:hypothetical protein